MAIFDTRSDGNLPLNFERGFKVSILETRSAPDFDETLQAFDVTDDCLVDIDVALIQAAAKA